MRKLGRMVRRVLTAVSLLLFVAVLAAWVRGYWSCDRWEMVRRFGQSRFDERWVGIEWDSASIYFDCGWIDPKRKAESRGWKVEFSHPHANEGVAHTFSWVLPMAQQFGDNVWYVDRFGLLIGRWYQRADGPSLRRSEFPVDTYRYYIAFPCWMAAIVFGALPSWRGWVWWRGVRRRRLASREGRCGVCGYDLRASPERCPECGTAVEARETPGGGAV